MPLFHIQLVCKSIELCQNYLSKWDCFWLIKKKYIKENKSSESIFAQKIMTPMTFNETKIKKSNHTIFSPVCDVWTVKFVVINLVFFYERSGSFHKIHLFLFICQSLSLLVFFFFVLFFGGSFRMEKPFCAESQLNRTRKPKQRNIKRWQNCCLFLFLAKFVSHRKKNCLWNRCC